MNRKQTSFLNFLILFVMIIGAFGFVSDGICEPGDPTTPVDTKEFDSVNLLLGELVTLKVYSLTRLSITNPGVADVANATEDEMLVVAKSVGHTVFFIWDEHGKRTFIVRVYGQELVNVKKRLEALFKKSDIEGLTVEINPMEARVMVSGILLEKDSKKFSGIMERVGGSVMNFTKTQAMEDLVQIDMQVAEINTTLQKSLGIDWTTDSNDSLVFTFPETQPSSPSSSFERLLEIGDFNRTASLLATVNALLQEGRGRVLSKPKLVVKSGNEASFNVGGQIPIRTTTTASSGTSTESVSFRDYGILMSITPRITKDRKVDMSLSVEISEIDTANSTDTDVAFTTRSATTSLLLDDRQTIVLAGLIKRSTGVTINKVPFLGDIPIIGMAFRSRLQATPDQETEVVISLTPTIIEQRYGDGPPLAKQGQKEMLKEEFKQDLLDMIGVDEAMEDSPDPADPGDFSDADQMDEFMLEDSDLEMDSAAMDSAAMDSEIDVGLDMDGYEDYADSEMDLETMDPIDTTGMDFDMADADAVDLPELGGDISDIMAAYIQTVQEKISQAISYPFEAAENGWEGTVKLTLTILQDGTLDNVDVKESSGHNVFDMDALNTAQILAPFESFPPELGLEEIIVTIPIVYSQGSASIDLAACQAAGVDEIAIADESEEPIISNGLTYAQAVQKRIAEAAIYPEEAKKYGWEGTVKLNLHILKDGTLDYALVKESSGYDIFDQCAVQTAKLIAPYSGFPSDFQLQELDVTVPIVYSLNNP